MSGIGGMGGGFKFEALVELLMRSVFARAASLNCLCDFDPAIGACGTGVSGSLVAAETSSPLSRLLLSSF